jgi:riboflavin kinase/FMN adenylyltransferase
VEDDGLAGHIRALKDIQLTTPSIVSIGMFDGVHLGHQRLLRRLVQEAPKSDRTSVVLTFFPHPDVVIEGVTGRYYLTTPDERARLILDMGVDVVITHAFNDQVRRIRAADFVDQLIQHLKMAALWVGPDFALGYKREGNVQFLRQQGAEKGFAVETVSLVTGNPGQVISSSRIREALRSGRSYQAAKLLGRPYGFSGKVVYGDRRGRLLGFPTANIETWEEQLLPAHGVYACWAYTEDGERHMAVTNIGVRPTFEGRQLMVEAHLLDFDRDIYGQPLRLEFLRRLRGEKRFNNAAKLTAQIQKDVQKGRQILAELEQGEA